MCDANSPLGNGVLAPYWRLERTRQKILLGYYSAGAEESLKPCLLIELGRWTPVCLSQEVGDPGNVMALKTTRKQKVESVRAL